MYNFIDVNDFQDEIILPSEAMNFNGVFLENEVPGYRTLYVSGREMLASELEFFDQGKRHGKVIKNRHFPERVITVGYQLMSPTVFDFRLAYNKMAKILNVNEAKLIFTDEPDKYFIGTLTSIGDVDPGKLCITGELEFTCADPFKYSVKEKSYDLSEKTIVYYEGTQDCYPEIRWKLNSNAGYVAVYKENAENIIQIGNPSEQNGSGNTFQTGDIVIAQCSNAEITLNNRKADGLGALGNTWESFFLSPGENTIGALVSGWSKFPEVQLTVREVWL